MRLNSSPKLKPLGNIFVHFMSGKWYRVILLSSAEFFYPVILSDLIGIQVLTGGDKPRPYRRRTSAQTVGAGFPARK
jgi:hypothetical protein